MHWTSSRAGDIKNKFLHRNMLIINEELAELVGILLGDRSLSKYKNKNGSNHCRVQITFHSEQFNYILYVSHLCQKVLGFRGTIRKRKGQKCTDIRIIREKILNTLLELGMVLSPKWNKAVIPEQFLNKQLGKYILRGYFDSDGSVVLANNNGILYPRLEMKISPSPMQNQFRELLELYDFNYGWQDIGKGKIRVQMNGLAALAAWKNIIGFSNKYYLDRYQKIVDYTKIHQPKSYELFFVENKNYSGG